MSTTSSYQQKFYWVQTPNGLAHSEKIGLFEFHTEQNARRYIKEEKIKGAKVLLVYRNITESVVEL